MADMPEDSVDLIVTSPPYNVRKNYGVSDEIPWDRWYDFVRAMIFASWFILRPGGVLALNVLKEARWQRDHKYAETWTDYDPNYITHRGKERNIRGKGRVEPVSHQVYGLMEAAKFKMRESIIWVKGNLSKSGEIQTISTNYQMGCDSDPYLRGTAEIILLGSKERWYHDGGTGRRGAKAMPFDLFTKDVWIIPSTSDSQHPAPFPEEVPNRLIRLFVHRMNTRDLPEPVVFDPFMGRGTTAIAAIKQDCYFYGCDINPEYVELANKRIEKARLEMAQLSFSV
jgi:site-specific DNA-methyltransferase (adenine-specific)